jgi:ATP-dependent Zn protease
MSGPDDVRPRTAACSESTEAALRQLALRSVGLSGADVERLVREARHRARREGRPLASADLEAMFAASRPLLSPEKRRRLAVHEAGHVLMRILLGVGELTLVTIDGAGGDAFTEAIMDDSDMETLERCEAYLQVLMAGRAAEQVVYGSALAGSGGTIHSDLARATKLATTMEVSLGFGASLPLLYRDPEHWQSLLRQDGRLARRVNTRMAQAERSARRRIASVRKQLDLVVDELLANGTIEGVVIQDLVRRVRGDRRS